MDYITRKLGRIAVLCVLLVIWLVAEALLSVRDARRDKKLKQEHEQAETLVLDHLRAPAFLRGMLVMFLVVIWGMVICFTLIGFLDESMRPSAEDMPAFCGLYLFLAAITLLFRYGLGFVWIEIIFTEREVIRKNGHRRKVYAWSEFGEMKQFHERVTFYDKSGKKIFVTSTTYDGFAGFYNLYMRKVEGYGTPE